jgi:ribonuclease HII
MTQSQREKAAEYIKRNALAWEIGSASEEDIDRLNVTGAEMKALHECLDRIKIRFLTIIMDGTVFTPYVRDGVVVEHRCIPKADSKCLAVSCASILAKTARDQYVRSLCEIVPELQERYDVCKNMGYPKPRHIQGIAKHGITQYHRKSYTPCQNAVYNPICPVIIDC